MILALRKYLLSQFLLFLCILLLSSSCQLYARQYQDFTYYAPIKILQSSEQSIFAAVENSQCLSVKSTLSGKDSHHKSDLTEIEEKDKESFSYKKSLANSDYFTSIFYAHLLSCFFSTSKATLPFCKHFSYFSSYRRHLIFQIFRI